MVYTIAMAWARGKVTAIAHESEVLRGNPLGDPTARMLHVYTPPSYGDGRRYPVVFLLNGFPGTGASFLNWSAWQETLPLRLDRLIGSGALPPCLVALPDCFTRLGGSQYVNSAAQGRYLDYLCDELVPTVDVRFGTLGDGARAIAGKSSGGIGALWTCIERPGLFAACGSQAGDCAFELLVVPELPKAALALQQRGGLAAYWEKLQREGPGPSDHELLLILAYAAAYSPRAGTAWGFDLPFDPETGVTRSEVFARWLEFDPVRAAVRRPEGLRLLKALHLDVGKADEYNLQLGLRLLTRELRRLDIPHVHEEFEGGHRNTQHRWDASLPYLVKSLPPAQQLK
jgi:S-formylglutathione hydrolase FrmB